MNYNKNTNQVYCHNCNAWIDLEKDTFCDNYGEIYCVDCLYEYDRITLLGYVWDLPD